MTLSLVASHAHRILGECQRSALQTAMVAVNCSAGLGVLGLGLYHGNEPAMHRLVGGVLSAAVVLSSAHPYSRIVGAAVATFVVSIMANEWKDNEHLPLGNKFFILLQPASVALTLAYRAYTLRV